MHGHLRLVAVLAAAVALALPAGAQAARCPNAVADPVAGQPRPRPRSDAVPRQPSTRDTRPRAADAPTASSPRRRTAYVNTMAARGFFAHVSPGGSTPASRIKLTLYLVDARSWSLGENLAWGGGSLATPRQMVAAWMRSPVAPRATCCRPASASSASGSRSARPQQGDRGGRDLRDRVRRPRHGALTGAVEA